MRIALVNAIAPPAAGSRAERTLHLAAAWRRQGHTVTVVRARLPDRYPARDAGLEDALLRSGARVVTLDGGALAALRWPGSLRRPAALLRRALAEAAWPDPWTTFARNAWRWIRERSDEFDVVVTSGQPWSDHLVGYEVARRGGPRWIADYGDPWSFAPGENSWGRTADRSVEQAMLRLASAIVVTTEPTRALFEATFEPPPAGVAVIPAGIPWLGFGPPPAASPPTLVHAGTVYGVRASVEPLLRAVESVRGQSAGGVRLVWYGELWRSGDESRVRAVADDYRRRATIDVVQAAEASAHVVVVLGNAGGLQVPGKVWRAVGTGRIVLAILGADDDPMRSLPELRARAIFAANDPIAIAAALRECVARIPGWDWGGSERPPGLASWDDRANGFAELAERAVRLETPTRARTDAALPAKTFIRRRTYTGARLAAEISRRLRGRRAPAGSRPR